MDRTANSQIVGLTIPLVRVSDESLQNFHARVLTNPDREDRESLALDRLHGPADRTVDGVCRSTIRHEDHPGLEVVDPRTLAADERRGPVACSRALQRPER